MNSSDSVRNEARGMLRGRGFPSSHRFLQHYRNQNVNLAESCTLRGRRAALGNPKFGSIWVPFGWNCAVVVRPENCVWFQTLNASPRSESMRDSPKRKRLVMERSQLLVPGPYNMFAPALPKVALAGSANAAGFK